MGLFNVKIIRPYKGLYSSVDSIHLYETHGIEKQINQAISNILSGESRSFEYQPTHK